MPTVLTFDSRSVSNGVGRRFRDSRGPDFWVEGSFRPIDQVGQTVWKSGGNGSGGSFPHFERSLFTFPDREV